MFETAVQIAFPGLDHFTVKIERTKQSKLGDYQCLAAMQIYQKLKQESKLGEIQSANQVAHRILAHIAQDNGVLEPTLDVNPIGFILCKVQASYLSFHVNSIFPSGKVTLPS